jgi:hypothetical protein
LSGRDHDFRREQQARHRRRVLQRETLDIRRVDGVQDNRGIFASLLDDLTQRLFDRARQDANADRLVFDFYARISATPPPRTTPSSTAARVACSASSTRAFGPSRPRLRPRPDS